MNIQSNKVELPAVQAAMLIRQPVEKVFEAFVNPDITSKFWFTKGSGRLETGKNIEWVWEMYDFKTMIHVNKVEMNNLISFNWVNEEGTENTVEITFDKKGESTAFISIVEKGWKTDSPDFIKNIIENTEGWALVLSALKALLEHNIILKVVADRHVGGLKFE